MDETAKTKVKVKVTQNLKRHRLPYSNNSSKQNHSTFSHEENMVLFDIYCTVIYTEYNPFKIQFKPFFNQKQSSQDVCRT